MESKHRISRLFKKSSKDLSSGNASHSSTSSTPERHSTSGHHNEPVSSPGRRRPSEDVAHRPLTSAQASPTSRSHHRSTRSKDVLDRAQPDHSRVTAETTRYSEDVADRNVGGSAPSHSHESVVSETGHLKNSDTQPALQFMSKHDGSTAQTSQNNGKALQRGGPDGDIAPALAAMQIGDGSGKGASTANAEASPVAFPPRNSSIDKTRQRKPVGEQFQSGTGGIAAETLAKLKSQGIDLNDSADTEVNTTYAPAVTHTTIVPEVLEVRQKVITREIHNHHYIHRILPVRDVEILPAKHFIRLPNGDLREIPAPPSMREYLADEQVQKSIRLAERRSDL